MAGIGFVLRKLYRQDNLSGLVRAGLHSAFASTGPWLFTVLALAIISSVGRGMVGPRILFEFRAVLIYNFSFSLVLAGPVFMVATRYLADCIYRRDITPVTGMLFGSLMLLWGMELIAAGAFYFFYADVDSAMAVSAIINFMLLSAVWLLGIFISALKNYHMITRAFLFGMTTAVAACLAFAEPYGAAGMLNGFSVGLSVIVALLMAGVLMEYPHPMIKPFAFLGYFRKYWELALGGLVAGMAMWVDKWVMWFAPEATQMASGLVTYPYYDSAMFLAYLSTVPSMAMFLFVTETRFFEQYARFYRDVEQKANFAKIEKNHRQVAGSIFGSAGYFFLLQGSIALLGILVAPAIISHLGGHYQQIGILRYGLLGSMFHVLTLFLLVLLSYFDHSRAILRIQAVFLIASGVLTWLSMSGGFQYYGFGYFMASFIAFIMAAMITIKYVIRLPYHAFITANASVR